jgi:hypothetical protein
MWECNDMEEVEWIINLYYQDGHGE